MKPVLSVLKRHPVLSTVFVAAVLVSLFFALRLVVFAVVWSDPERHEQPPAPWMTIRYVARSWDMPPEILGDALALGHGGVGRGMTLKDIADMQGRSVDQVIADLEATIAERPERK